MSSSNEVKLARVLGGVNVESILRYHFGPQFKRVAANTSKLTYCPISEAGETRHEQGLLRNAKRRRKSDTKQP